MLLGENNLNKESNSIIQKNRAKMKEMTKYLQSLSIQLTLDNTNTSPQTLTRHTHIHINYRKDKEVAT